MEFNIAIDGHTVNIVTMLLVSTLLGSIIGIEREVTSKFAGLRTHILVCLGSTVFTILSIYAFPTITAAGNPVAFGDPARIAAQVLTGIGFIGGGTVLRHGTSVYGLTTAATLWISASIGMAVGAGEYMLGIVSTILTVLILTLIRVFERTVIQKISQKGARLKATLTVKCQLQESVVEKLNANLSNIEEIKFSRCNRDDQMDNIMVVFNVFSSKPIKDSYTKIAKIEGIEEISIKSASFE